MSRSGERSRRKKEPLRDSVAVLLRDEAENELYFPYSTGSDPGACRLARGAFTGATGEQRGLFEAAHRGTIFLDEVGDPPPAMQVKLLRVLQDGEIMPLGTTKSRRVDVRMIAVTNRDLRATVDAGPSRDHLQIY